jgi:hypothetical protein
MYKVDKIILGRIESVFNEGTKKRDDVGSSTKRVIRTEDDLRSEDKDCTRNNEPEEGGDDQLSSGAQGSHAH